MSKEMTPKDALSELCDLATPNGDCLNYVIGLSGIILKALDRLELLEKIFSDSHICEIKARFNEIECSADKCDNCPLGIGDGICLKNTFEKKWELQKENQALRDKLNINFEECADELCEALTQRDKLYDENLELQKENQDLKLTNQVYIEESTKLIEEYKQFKELANQVIEKFQIGNKNLTEENEKLEKVIEILKDKKVDLVILLSSNDFKEYNANITIRINGVTYLKGNNYTLTQQEYELIKEFLESE